MFQGLFTAIITPFKNDRIDYDNYYKILERQIQAGVDGIVPCGTTGESPTLDYEEHSELIQKTVEFVNKRVLVIAGTGSNSTREAISLTEHACKDGVDGILSVNPYYNKPTQDGLFQHFKSIADHSTKPIMLYNVPGRTAVNLLPETTKRLSEHPMIRCIKEATGDIGQMVKTMAILPPGFTLLSGDDNLTLPILSIGGKGVVSVVSNLFPGSIKSMIGLYQSGKLDEAREKFYQLLPIFNMAFLETNPIPIKTAMSWMGYCTDEVRLPLTKLSSGPGADLFKQKIFELKDKGFD